MADEATTRLRRALRDAGLSREAVKAAWPSWWTEEAGASKSARTELRFALARNLGLSPRALLGERVEFIWRDQGRFKSLTSQTDIERAALNSFGTSVGRLALQACPGDAQPPGMTADDLRRMILESSQVVSLQALIATCWALGIPVLALRVFPLGSKSMHAMVVSWSGRHAVLLARDASFPAPVAFTLAHELAHVALGHVGDASALVDLEDPATSGSTDQDETAADMFALAILTGTTKPNIQVTRERFGGRQLAEAATREGPPRGIEPGTLALCTGFATGNWAAAMSALAYIYDRAGSVSDAVNRVAAHNLDWAALDDGSSEYLRSVMGL
jgi:hypothetical protein